MYRLKSCEEVKSLDSTLIPIIGFQVSWQVKQGLAMLGDYEPVSFKLIAEFYSLVQVALCYSLFTRHIVCMVD